MKTLTTFLLLISCICVFAQENTRVACVGNSVTFGYLLKNREQVCYPAQLQDMLGDKYIVGNFGKSGATLLNNGHRPYTKEPEYQKALDFNPDIVIIHLGLNDTDPRNWPNYKDNFIQDYLSLINSFKEKNPKIKVWICKMTPITFRHSRFISGTRDWHREIQTYIEEVADYADVELIDLEEGLYNRPDLLPDALHPDKEGANIIARTVYSAITGDYGGLQVPITYSDNMVLQRNKPLTIRGIADANDKVSVSINGNTYSTRTKSNGKWEITLPAMEAKKSLSLKISTSKQQFTYNNVAIGEVWLCSGQSNMAFTLKQDANFSDIPKDLNNPNIRFFDMKPRWETNAIKWSVSALDTVNSLGYYNNTSWEVCDYSTAKEMSAIAYYFGNMLSDSLDVTIGLIHNAIGGSTCESWIDRYTLEEEFPAILNNYSKNDFAQPWVRGRLIENIALSEKQTQRHPYEPCYLFEAGIIPLNHYEIKGAIWYQGESNAHNMEAFDKLFRLMNSSWRTYWNNNELPIHFVQLSSHNRPSWPEFRDLQRQHANEIPYTYMVVSSDYGNPNDVHPRHKKPIGERLALSSLNRDYGFGNIIPSGPEYKSMRVSNGSAYISFNYTNGLRAADNKEIVGFEIADTKDIYYPAQASVMGNEIVLRSDKVQNPKYVRYAWLPSTNANLVNNANLPTSTFQTNMNQTKTTSKVSLPNYPIEGGVSAPFAGVVKNNLIVIGGCNFPDKPPHEGGSKKLYKNVYSLDLSTTDTKWNKCKSFPTEIAYGISVNTSKGIVCVGGQDAKSALDKAWLVDFDTDKNDIKITNLPSLPVKLFNGGGCVINNIVYISGGKLSSEHSGSVFSLNLDNIESGWQTIEADISERQQPVVFTNNGSLYMAGGYNEQAAEAFTDVLRFNFSKKQWEKYAYISLHNGKPVTFIGASAINITPDCILFVGGVDYNRFDSALKRIKRTQEAEKEGNSKLHAELKQAGKEYMTQNIGWYKFRNDLLTFNPKTKTWQSLGEYSEAARAGAGVTINNNKVYIVCGELKPGVRSSETYELEIKN
ncbi:sialate O-acetylesterase [Dysgonomonadaceae bacterium PH5-43]|nr:sialate O-acetylesterase [Dysgonomonadaceae bacterium PH5-43]